MRDIAWESVDTPAVACYLPDSTAGTGSVSLGRCYRWEGRVFPRGMSVSLVKVSKVAGVSKSTVSRVLNQDPRVSQEAIRAVQEAVARLGYVRPEGMGRPRRSSNGLTKGSIALVFPDTNPAAIRTVLSGRILLGVEEVLRSRGINLTITGLPGPDRLPAAVEQRQVDGCLIRGTAPESGRRSFIESFGRLPCVMVFAPKGPTPDRWDVVQEDNEAISRLALDYLVSRRRRRLTFLSTQPDHPSFRVRQRAFLEFAEQASLTVHVVSSSTFSPEKLVEQALTLPGGRPDGIFVPGGDDAVVEVYRSLTARGVVVGRDLDLISCNNDGIRLATLDPRLPNIDINAEAIGRAAAEALLWRLKNPRDPQRRLTIAPTLTDPEAPSRLDPHSAVNGAAMNGSGLNGVAH